MIHEPDITVQPIDCFRLITLTALILIGYQRQFAQIVEVVYTKADRERTE